MFSSPRLIVVCSFLFIVFAASRPFPGTAQSGACPPYESWRKGWADGDQVYVIIASDTDPAAYSQIYAAFESWNAVGIVNFRLDDTNIPSGAKTVNVSYRPMFDSHGHPDLTSVGRWTATNWDNNNTLISAHLYLTRVRVSSRKTVT